MALSPAVVAALGRCPRLWGWGLNGDPVSEAGARVPAAGLVRRAMLSHMADDVLAGALNHVRPTCASCTCSRRASGRDRGRRG